MDSHSIVSISAIIVLLILSVCLSAAETAFATLNKLRLKNAAAEGNKKAALALRLTENHEKLTSTTLIAGRIVNITMTAIAIALFLRLFDAGAVATVVAVAAMAVLVLAVGEALPRCLAVEYSEEAAMSLAAFLQLFMVLFTPLSWIFARWKRLVSRIFKLPAQSISTEDELMTIVEEAETEGSLDNGQSELIQNAIEFNDLEAWDVLTPRIDLIAIDAETSEEEIADIFRRTGFSRLPVYEDEIDNVLGVLNQKDFHNYIKGSGKPIAEYVKPVVFVAGSIRIAVLLKKMQAAKTHIAVVVDEYGGTEGIVTMEDIIEELVGEIYDEHDAVTSQDILPLRDGSYRVLGSANIEKMLDFFGIEAEMSMTTVNGWAMVALDNLPKAGDTFEETIDGKLFRCRVTKADGRRAKEINVRVEEPRDGEEYGIGNLKGERK